MPGPLIPEDMDKLEFDDLYRLLALAQRSRKMEVRDLAEAVNKGVVQSFPE